MPTYDTTQVPICCVLWGGRTWYACLTAKLMQLRADGIFDEEDVKPKVL